MFKKLFDKNGTFVLENSFSIIIMAVCALLVISTIAWSVAYFNLSATASDVTRQIEIKGTTENAAALITDPNIELRIYNEAGTLLTTTTKIQFGEAFFVELSTSRSIKVGGIVDLPIPMSATVKGRSERYWK